ncbi:kinase-like domain-containing protein [Tuber indicum]|nr:kinase-like domain-containing protein [Tuber indicum]
MSTEQSDQVEQYRLKTQFLKNCVRHTTHSDNHEGAREKVEDWRNCEMLGHGGSSVVDKQLELNTGCYRAVKAIDKRRLPSGLGYSRELIVMADLAKHASLFMQFLGWFEESDTLYIAMEYIQLGDLRKYMSRPLPQRAVQQITNQLLQGLKVMHEKGIAHRDLKPENIFVVSMSPVQVKLGDFGISKRIRAQDLTTYHTRLFTRQYAAPEVLGVDANSETSVYTKAVDIWSLGCVIYELLVGAKLFGPEGRIYSYFHGLWSFPGGELNKLSPPIDDAGISLIKSMISLQPDGRPSAVEALGHTWIIDPGSGTSDEVAQIPVYGSIGVAEIGKRFLTLSPRTELPDLVEWYRIKTEFFRDHVRHTTIVENLRSRDEKVKEVWHNDGELCRGGFSVVHKQIQRTTGRYRAVKMIDKTRLSASLSYTRELLVMAILAKVCVLTLEGPCPGLLHLRDLLLWSNRQLF